MDGKKPKKAGTIIKMEARGDILLIKKMYYFSLAILMLVCVQSQTDQWSYLTAYIIWRWLDIKSLELAMKFNCKMVAM